MKNTLTNTRVEFHILQSFPVTCLNRDDVGAPKTAVIGGTNRARVSSQCWKRQVRMAMQGFGVKLAYRTKKIEQLLDAGLTKRGASAEQAEACATAIAKELAADTLLFVSESEADAFAAFAEELGFDSEKIKAKDLAKVSKKALNPAIDALDVALFGRMVAKAPDMNVEAAASFAHAISTHKVSNEIEFFTAIDDLNKKTSTEHLGEFEQKSHNEGEESKAGSAHMGSLEFNSATYYRYVSLDLGQLLQHVPQEDLGVAVEAFVKALFVAVPSARQTTQSGASPWEFARVLVRQGQRLQVPFEAGVKSKGSGYLAPSIEFLKTYLDEKKSMFGSLFGEVASYEWGVDTAYSIDDLIDSLKQHV